MKKMNSLAVKLPLILCSVTAVLIATLLFNTLRIAGNGISKSRFEGFATTVKGYSSVFDAWFRTQSYLLETYAAIPLVRNFLISGSETVPPDLHATLNTFKAKNACTIHIGIINKDGIIVEDTDYTEANGLGARFSGKYPVVWQELQSRKYGYGSVVYGSELIKSSVNGEFSFIFATPVKNGADEIGYVFTVFNLREFFKNYIQGIELGKTGGLSIIAPDLTIVMNTDYSLLGTKAQNVYGPVFSTKSASGVVSYEEDGEQLMGSYTRLKYVPWITSMTMTSAEIFEENKKAVFIGSSLGVFTIVIIAIFIVTFIRSITTPLTVMVQEAQRIENGDLRANKHRDSKPRNDEIGELASSFDNMRDKLVETITEVNNASNNIIHASEVLASGNLELSRRTEAQAANLEETAASMEEMASTIKSSTEYSVTGNDMMISSKDSIDDAGNIILETTKNIEEVYEASTKIKDITKIIENIAFQTNILALNASVEAARAGEQGKGFAVVASEVRNLAQTTQSSVKDITDLVDNAYDKIDKATATAHQSQEIFAELKMKIDETAQIMQGISSAAVEQQAGVDQVNRAVSEMDAATQQNSSLVNEAEQSSRDLVVQANALKESMSFFRL